METTRVIPPARLRRTGLVLVTLGVLLSACGGADDPADDATGASAAAADADASSDDADAAGDPDGQDAAGDGDEPDAAGGSAGADTDGADDVEEELAEGASQVLVQFRGEQIVVTGDDEFFSCLTMGGTDTVAFGILDDAGNDVSVNVTGDSVNAVASLADGTTWNQTPDGVLNVSETPDGGVRMSIQMTEIDTGESESMDVRLNC